MDFLRVDKDTRLFRMALTRHEEPELVMSTYNHLLREFVGISETRSRVKNSKRGRKSNRPRVAGPTIKESMETYYV